MGNPCEKQIAGLRLEHKTTTRTIKVLTMCGWLGLQLSTIEMVAKVQRADGYSPSHRFRCCCMRAMHACSAWVTLWAGLGGSSC